MYNLTPKQREVFDVIAEYIAGHNGTAPSVREIMKLAGVTGTNRIMDKLNALEERGWIKRLPARHRSITIVAGAGQ